MIKTRIEEKSNYKSIFVNNKTIRFAIDPTKPILELEYPEFYDVKITNKCFGGCEFCYMDSRSDDNHYDNIIEKVKDFFGKMDDNQRPFQLALGGGEPTEHPQFLELLKILKEDLNICPNYTTNGMFIENENKESILEYTKKYCGAVAISTHAHLKKYWEKASNYFIDNNVKLNFHIIISDKKSIDLFLDIYEEWVNKIDYFVLLPQINMGRSKGVTIDWDYFIEKLPKEKSKIAFGANFYPYLTKEKHDIEINLYEPEIMSKFLDLKDMKIYGSSFST